MAASPQFDIQPLGDSALIVEWRNISPADALPLVQSACQAIQPALDPAIIEAVPGFVSVTVHYDCRKSDWPTVHELIRRVVGRVSPLRITKPRQFEIPVCYAEEMGLDLGRVSETSGLSREEVVNLHSSASYVVQLIGFAPGFCYLSGMPKQLATPRLAVPRTRVPAGSVGIGGEQSGIYPVEIAGGWNIIGRTPLGLFRADADPPAVLSPGDLITFRSIERTEFDAMRGGT